MTQQRLPQKPSQPPPQQAPDLERLGLQALLNLLLKIEHHTAKTYDSVAPAKDYQPYNGTTTVNFTDNKFPYMSQSRLCYVWIFNGGDVDIQFSLDGVSYGETIELPVGFYQFPIHSRGVQLRTTIGGTAASFQVLFFEERPEGNVL